jgi:hypothetical protein
MPTLIPASQLLYQPDPLFQQLITHHDHVHHRLLTLHGLLYLVGPYEREYPIQPMLTPIHGHWTPFFPSPAAADVKEPTRLSYSPPAAMGPTPTWICPSLPPLHLLLVVLRLFLEAAGDVSDGVDAGPFVVKLGSAEAATVASYVYDSSMVIEAVC